MRVALVRELRGIGGVELSERPDPTPAARQALVRVRGAGVGVTSVTLGVMFVPPNVASQLVTKADTEHWRTPW